ncbi:MAG TPA: hypothetical protein VHB70_06030 [Parafilimonas sp.]|nr:hypothetical protein [Parafilimonas sp.]
MTQLLDENHFEVRVNDKTYKVTVSYEGMYISHYRIEQNNEYLLTISMNEDGNWQAENTDIFDQDIIDQIGQAIEEYDVN